MKLLATGDLHLGSGSRLSPDRLAEQEENWQAILGIAQARNVDAVLLAGDVFHRQQPSTEELLAFERPLIEYGGRIIAIPGNGSHDSVKASGAQALDPLHEVGMLMLCKRPEVVYVGDVGIACLPWVSVSRLVAAEGGGDRDAIYRDAADMLLRAAADLRATIDGPAVLMLHYSVSGTALPSGLPVDSLREVVLPVEGLDELGFDAIVAGHVHKAQLFGANGLYVGSPMPLSFGEPGEHGVWVVDVAQGGMEFIPLDSRGFLTLDLKATASLDVSDWRVGCHRCHGTGGIPAGPFGGARDACPVCKGSASVPPDVDDAYVKIRLHGTREEIRHVDQSALVQAVLDAGAHNVWVETVPEKESRARVDGLDGEVSDTDAFDLWLATQPEQEPHAGELRGLFAELREEVVA